MRSVVYTMESRRWNKSSKDLSLEIRSTPPPPPPGYPGGIFFVQRVTTLPMKRTGSEMYNLHCSLYNKTDPNPPIICYFYLYLIIHPLFFYHSPKQLISISLMISSISSLFLSCSLIISSSSLFIGTGQTEKQQNNK